MPDESWIAFFTAEVGATSALAGLVIVAISINIARILSFPQLPGRAAETLIVLAAALLVSSLMLFPPGILWSATFLAIAALTWVLVVSLQIRDLRRERTRPFWMVSRIVLAQWPTVPMLVGGALIAGGNPAGVAWLAVSVLLALVISLMNTWVLLVEILR